MLTKESSCRAYNIIKSFLMLLGLKHPLPPVNSSSPSASKDASWLAKAM